MLEMTGGSNFQIIEKDIPQNYKKFCYFMYVLSYIIPSLSMLFQPCSSVVLNISFVISDLCPSVPFCYFEPPSYLIFEKLEIDLWLPLKTEEDISSISNLFME
jgi:hypothetical protein